MGHRNDTDECIRCGSIIEFNQKAVGMIFYCQTVGIKPRQKSKAMRIYFCTRCATQMALGPKPQNGAINVATWQMVKTLVGSDPAVASAAWEELNHAVLAPEKTLPEAEILPPQKRLREAS
jgi:hypothetical protein